MTESLKQIRQRVGWGIARSENAVEEFGGSHDTVPSASALGHLRRAFDALSEWIAAGFSDYPPTETVSEPTDVRLPQGGPATVTRIDDGAIVALLESEADVWTMEPGSYAIEQDGETIIDLAVTG